MRDAGDWDHGGYDGVLEPGMVVSVESYVGRLGGREGVKLEEQLLITERGHEQARTTGGERSHDLGDRPALAPRRRRHVLQAQQELSTGQDGRCRGPDTGRHEIWGYAALRSLGVGPALRGPTLAPFSTENE